MSGILAILSVDGKPVPERLARNQLDAIAHRGDSQPRLWHTDGAVLGHVNFATTHEAEREELPASDSTGRYWLTWDGRLDNRAELASKLNIDPELGLSLTDADYVLLAYREWGEDCVHHLLGDWAMVIWDNRTRSLFAAKDPLGWRQLYFAQHDGLILLGSEPQQLLAGGHIPKDINHDYVLKLLSDALQELGDTHLAKVDELVGGQILTVRDGQLHVRTFWSEPRVTPRGYRRPQAYVEEFASLFEEATRVRLRTNRRVGVLLSGGLDSSYVTAIASGLGADVHAFTGFVPNTRWMDERHYAALVRDRLGIDGTEVDVSDCWSLSSHWLADTAFDQPEIPPQGASHVRLAAAAASAGVGVLLGGDGADEWLGGNGMHLADAVTHGRLPTAWRMAGLRKKGLPRLSLLGKAMYRSTVPFAIQDRLVRMRGRRPGLDLLPLVEHKEDWIGIRAYGRTLVYEGERARATYWRLYRQFAGSIVAWRERNAFAPNGIEGRTPYNDLRIVELLASTPEWVKRFNGRTKDILRAAESKVLPKEIPERNDFGLFTELMNLGVMQAERRRVEIAMDTLHEIPGIHSQLAREEIDRWTKTGHNWWEPNWRLITTGLWLHQLGDPCGDRMCSTISPRKEVTNHEEGVPSA